MGVLREEEWRASFISFRDDSSVWDEPSLLHLPAARQYRREFVLDKPVRRATVYATALGVFELHLNGERIGDSYFAPGWTDYRQRAYYTTYDVTDALRTGNNAIGAWIAEGWYSGYVGFGLLTGLGPERTGRSIYGKTPSLLIQLEIEYEDGSIASVVTDPTWRVSGEGPIQEADFQMGERYDATREMIGWRLPGYDDSAWEPAVLAADNGDVVVDFYSSYHRAGDCGRRPVGPRPRSLGFRRPRLEAFPGVPVRVTEEIRPVEVVRRSEGGAIFDLGQNVAGVVRLRVTGPRGRQVRLRYGEMLHPDGSLMTENLRKARAEDCYVLRGDPGGEVYQPRFTSHGFRYVEVTGLTEEPALDTVTGLVMHSDTPLTSSFECSDPTVNRLFQNIVWTQRGNFIDVPTDCPQRDERLGWTGDAQVYIGSATINADVSAFFSKWFRELMEAQRPSGAFPGFAPTPFYRNWDFGVAWADAGVICPWTFWQAYGDTRIIESCWEPMTRFMRWRERTSRGRLGVTHGNPWGDWLSQGEETPIDYIDTVYYALTAEMMRQMAEAIGRDGDAVVYLKLRDEIRRAFCEKYLTTSGQLSIDTQTAYALALYADLVPVVQRAALGERLAAKIASNGNRMATGFLGANSLLPSLSASGNHDLAVFLLQSREFPSWGYEVQQGATTVWERWDSYTKEDAFGRHNAAMNSFSHYAFGAVCEWMFKSLVGVRAASPGYSRIHIEPRPPSPGSNADIEPISWVKASQRTIRGEVAVAWRLHEDRFDLAVTIPTNTVATVVLPTGSPDRVTEGGARLDAVHGVRVLGNAEGRTSLEVDSGEYRFTVAGGLSAAVKSLRVRPRTGE